MKRVLVDTGPLVAILSKRDQFHDACVEAMRGMAPPLLTCWPVLTEAAWLLRSQPSAIDKLLKSCTTGFLRILSLEPEDVLRISAILMQYERLRPQLADAALINLAERERIDTIFTLDQRDFRVYRLKRNRSFRIVPELRSKS